MKKINLRFLILPILCALLAISVNAQIESITEVKDVKPTDKFYVALQSLIENYEIDLTDKDDMFRAGDAVTRLDFAFMLDSGFDWITKKYGQNLLDLKLYERFSVNNLNLTSVDEIKDISKKDYYWGTVKVLTERYGIDICDADKNFRPTKHVTEKEFYTWIAKIFDGNIGGNPSATKALTRGEFVIVMNAAFENVHANIRQIETDKLHAEKLLQIKGLPTLGKAEIIDFGKVYKPEPKLPMPAKDCIDYKDASRDLRKASQNGGIIGDYQPKNGDIGDIVFETNNTCKKGEKLVLLRIGTAIVTMHEKGIKRLK
jgi:S-layer homology domain